MAKVLTSYVEQQNLTMRMQLRRLTRLTNAFNNTLRVTSTMEVEIADHVWGLENVILMADSDA